MLFRLFFSVLLALFVTGIPGTSQGSLDRDVIKPLGSTATSALGTALARADVALCKSVIVPAHLRGDVGEAFMGKFVLEQQLVQSGNWQSMTTRLGRQGIDGIYIQFNSRGNPTDLIVAEAKYGNSELKTTKDGWQLSSKWTQKRLVALSHRYKEVAQLKNMQRALPPNVGAPPRHLIEVQLANGEKGIFWRHNANDSWKYNGTASSLSEARKKAEIIGQYLNRTADGTVDIKRRLFKFKVSGDILKVQAADAVHINNLTGEIPKPRFTSYEIDLAGLNKDAYVRKVRNELSTQIRKKMPHISEGEARLYGDEIVRGAKNTQVMIEKSRVGLAKSTAINASRGAFAGALVVGGLSLLEQAFGSTEKNWARVVAHTGLGGVTTGAGILSGQGAVIALTKSQLGYNSMRNITSIFKLPNVSLATNITGSLVGAAAASILYAYGGVMMGEFNLEEANRISAIGVLSTAGGAAASGGTLVMVTALGTSSTGVAISSLNGVAASNATMAWLGGGATSAGGGGMVVGGFVVGGVFIVTAVAVTAAATYVFYLYDEKMQDKLVTLMANSLLNDEKMLKVSVNRAFGRQ